MAEGVKRYLQFKKGADTHTGFALGTLFLFWVLNVIGTFFRGNSFSIGSREFETNILWFIFHVIMGTLFVGVYLSSSYLTKEMGLHTKNLGIRQDNIILSLALSAVIAIPYIVYPAADIVFDINFLQHVLVSLFTGVWQVIFLHGWLQNQFERAFGPVFAILLVGLSYVLINIGIVPVEGLSRMLVIGMGSALAFSLTRSIFILWPLPWVVSYTAASLRGGETFAWGTVILFAVLAAVYFVTVDWVREEAARAGLLKSTAE